MSESDAPDADWYPDPSGRFQFRYWDGETWTGHVSTDGKTDWDPPAEAEATQDTAVVTEGDSAWAPQTSDEAAAAVETGPDQSEAAQPEAVESAAAQPEPAQPEPAQPERPEPAQSVADQPDVGTSEAPRESEPAAQVQPMTTDEPSDTNLVANRRASLDADVLAWLDEVAGQVEPRLTRINGAWTTQPQAEAARACAYGLLVGHLARIHPHMRPELGQVAEAHPSFTTLESGSRLDTLEQIAGDPARAAAWLGALIGTDDVDRIGLLFD